MGEDTRITHPFNYESKNLSWFRLNVVVIFEVDLHRLVNVELLFGFI